MSVETYITFLEFSKYFTLEYRISKEIFYPPQKSKLIINNYGVCPEKNFFLM